MDLFNIAESAGVVFAIIGVWLTIRQNVWCWPAGILNVSLFTVVFLHARLYGAMALQVVYLAMSIYGWYAWLHGDSGDGALKVSRAPAAWLGGLAAAAAVGTVALGVFLKYQTDEALPFWDAGTTAFSLAAQWMITRKWIENWIVWLAVDVIYVWMYVSQRLYQTAGLYALFLVLAAMGYREWRASMKSPAPLTEPA